MDEDKLNISVRKFLKVVGVTAQREIEKAVRPPAGRLQHRRPGVTPSGRLSADTAAISMP
jgi:hypothetical protein